GSSDLERHGDPQDPGGGGGREAGRRSQRQAHDDQGEKSHEAHRRDQFPGARLGDQVLPDQRAEGPHPIAPAAASRYQARTASTGIPASPRAGPSRPPTSTAARPAVASASAGLWVARITAPPSRQKPRRIPDRSS